MGPGLNKFLWVLVLAAAVEVDDILTVIPFYYPLENKALERVLTCVREVIVECQETDVSLLPCSCRFKA
eukprot:6369678-Amphidinium_carterae.1